MKSEPKRMCQFLRTLYMCVSFCTTIIHDTWQNSSDLSPLSLLSTKHYRLQVALQLKSLGVTIDSHLRFDIRGRKVARACDCHIRALHHVHSFLNDVAQTITCSIVATTLDYCNALLCSEPEATLDQLQHVQHNLATVVCQGGGHTDAGLMIRSLHWLPVRQRVTYKMALTAHKVRATATPAYLSDQHGHCGHSTLCNWLSLVPTLISHDALSVTWLLPFGTPCLLNCDCATALLHSNDT